MSQSIIDTMTKKSFRRVLHNAKKGKQSEISLSSLIKFLVKVNQEVNDVDINIL